MAGLAAGGVGVETFDLIVGTSAGATVAAQITGGTPLSALCDAILAERPSARPSGRAGTLSGPSYLEWSDAIIRSASDAADMRRRLGAAALELAGDDPSGSDRWREVVAARLPGARWPEQDVRIAAVEARTGLPVVFDRDSGIALVDAVAASTSAMVPYRLGEARYLNGGYRRNENADLAAGYANVLVLSPFSGRSRHPREWGMDLDAQLAELRAGGSSVIPVFPDARAGDVFDANALDPSTRPPAARGGYAQGRDLAPALADF